MILVFEYSVKTTKRLFEYSFLVVCVLVSVIIMKLLSYYVFVTGSAKTSYVRTKTEIQFIIQDHCYTQEVSMDSVSTAQCEWVCFSGGNFADHPVMCPGTVSVGS